MPRVAVKKEEPNEDDFDDSFHVNDKRTTNTESSGSGRARKRVKIEKKEEEEEETTTERQETYSSLQTITTRTTTTKVSHKDDDDDVDDNTDFVIPSNIDQIIRYMDELEPDKNYYETQQDSRGGCSSTRGKLRKFCKKNPNHPSVRYYVQTNKWQPPDKETLYALIEVIKTMIKPKRKR